MQREKTMVSMLTEHKVFENGIEVYSSEFHSKANKIARSTKRNNLDSYVTFVTTETRIKRTIKEVRVHTR